MRITAATVLATLACLAHADDQFTCPKEAGFVVYSELKLDESTACISYNNDTAKLSITNTSKNIKTENKSLIEISDIREEIVHLEQDENISNLYFEYPNNVYLIKINTNTGKLIEATQTFKTDAMSNEEANSTFTLRTKKNYIATAKFPELTKNYLFGKQQMEIHSSAKLKITSPKTYLWNSPNDTKPTKMYLIKGDHVEINRYENGKLKIIYT